MFFASAFAKKLQLLHDDELRRREPHGAVACHYCAPVRERPALKITTRRNINVGLINRMVMTQIEMSVFGSCGFRLDDFRRRRIKIRLWKNR